MKKVLDFRVVAEGVEEKGHPVTRITKSYNDACEIADQLHKQYPTAEIVTYFSSEEELSRIVPGIKETPPELGTALRNKYLELLDKERAEAGPVISLEASHNPKPRR